MIISKFENDTWATSAIHTVSFDAGFRFDLKLVSNFITVFVGGTADLAKRAKEKSHERFLKQTFDKNSNKQKQRKKLRWKDDNKRENYIFTATLFINSDRCVFSLLLLLSFVSIPFFGRFIWMCVAHSAVMNGAYREKYIDNLWLFKVYNVYNETKAAFTIYSSFFFLQFHCEKRNVSK